MGKREATPLEYAQAGYEEYARSTGGKTFDGRDMPAWADLGERIQLAWAMAAGEIRNLVVNGVNDE